MNITFTGIDMHIGSQITSIQPFAAAVEKLAQIYFELRESGLKLEHYDVGGGIGVKYGSEESFYSRLCESNFTYPKKIGLSYFL
jgi:diaminopimelate decarboxylase